MNTHFIHSLSKFRENICGWCQTGLLTKLIQFLKCRKNTIQSNNRFGLNDHFTRVFKRFTFKWRRTQSLLFTQSQYYEYWHCDKRDKYQKIIEMWLNCIFPHPTHHLLLSSWANMWLLFKIRFYLSILLSFAWEIWWRFDRKCVNKWSFWC